MTTYKEVDDKVKKIDSFFPFYTEKSVDGEYLIYSSNHIKERFFLIPSDMLTKDEAEFLCKKMNGYDLKLGVILGFILCILIVLISLNILTVG